MLFIAIGALSIWGALDFWRSTPDQIVWSQVIRLAMVAVLYVGFPLLVFVGLVRRRSWARWASMGFALALLVLVAIALVKEYSENTSTSAAEQAGGWIARIAIAALALLYPLRLYFSRKVRAFFNRPH